MSRIKGKDTTPEVIVRRYLFSKGMRFRKNDKRLPGHPDIVLPKYHTVIFVNGCFWHGHEGCRYATVPKTNVSFWIQKIETNRDRDVIVCKELQNLGWKVLTVWECQLKRNEAEHTLETLCDAVSASF